MQNLANQVARSILTGFERHFSVFQEISGEARGRFERADWVAAKDASAKRINFYDKRVKDAITKVVSAFGIQNLDADLWKQVKKEYVQLLEKHHRPELAETFYNSVFCHMFAREYYNNDKIFVESLVDPEELAERNRVYLSFHLKDGGLETCVEEILSGFYFSLPYEDLSRDIESISAAFRELTTMDEQDLEETRIDVLENPFYRNKAAYLIGRVRVRGETVHPFVIPLMNNEQGGIYADTLMIAQSHLTALFSFARTYFMVKTSVPAATVNFLASIMPAKSLPGLYMSIGFHKQAKNEFYREFLRHLDDSDDQFEVAAGIRGLVMAVFTLPSYPYVFKIIRDKFPPQKNVTRASIKASYQQVKKHDRVGRMADTLEFSDVAFPLDRFSDELLAELQETAPSLLEITKGNVIVRHLYIERRMIPLNIYLEQASEGEVKAALADWSLALKQLMSVNIFPGDLLLKNFGVTRSGKVVFYDYDEICYLTECNFRAIPEPRTPEDEMASEPWYSISKNDVFPEEFPAFLLADLKQRKILTTEHADLFDFRFWKVRQDEVNSGVVADIFPYPQSIRFQNSRAEQSTD